MSEESMAYPADDAIVTIRGQKVMLDADLARIYGVTTRVLNQAVKRNRERFPDDFMFRTTKEEAEACHSRAQAVTLNGGAAGMRSQSVTASEKRNVRFLPFAFTEHGAIMAAAVLNSPRAVEMSVFVVRAFVKLREQLLATATLAQRLAEVERTLLTHDATLRDLYQKIRPLLLPGPQPIRKPIGFGVKERRAAYRVRTRGKKRKAP